MLTRAEPVKDGAEWGATSGRERVIAGRGRIGPWIERPARVR